MDRTILHCDMNSFFANVELLEHPELAGLPVAVAGNPADRHGIILAKNQEAKLRGVKTAETIVQARKKCPNLRLLPAHHDKYERYCGIINSIYLRYTDMVEPFSIDESWLDISASLKYFGKDGRQIADEIRQVVRSETGLTLSVGVSYNKIFAKMGSDYKKPDATTIISRENYRELLWPLSASEMFFVGRKTAERLASMGIETIGDIALADPKFLDAALGKLGLEIYRFANGLDDSEVARYTDQRECKSVGNGMTFRRDLKGREDVRTAVTSLSDKVSARLRKQGLYASGVKVDIKNPQFCTITRQTKLEGATDSGAQLAAAAMELIDRNWRYSDPIRLLTITGINISAGEPEEQISMFVCEDGTREKYKAIDAAVDSIRSKYGRHSIMQAALIGNDLGISYKKSKGEDIVNEEEL